METKLLTLRDYSLSFNQIFSESGITRDYLIDEIEELATNDSKLVVVEGVEAIGKTNLLLQFAMRHKNDCLSYFINPAFRFTYKLDYLMEDIGKQIFFLNTSEIPEDDFSITEGVFNRLIFDLIKAPNRKKNPIFFVIDGLDQIEKADVELLKSTLQNLPWATNYFYFIVSGDREKLKGILPDNALNRAKSFRVPRFSPEETAKFFGFTENINNDYVNEIHATWKGHPERLSQIKRILDSGIDIKDFLQKDDIREKNDLLEVEWNQSSIKDLDFDNDIIKLISIISLDDNTRSITKISDIIHSNEDILKEQIADISFLTIKNIEVSFVSASYRNFVAKKFSKYESRIFSILIEYYTEQEGIDSVMNLPTLFEKNREWSSIVDLLTIDNLGLIISSSKSFADIKKQINYGFKASNNLKKSYNDVLKFSLYRSSIRGLQKSDTREAQIEAYIALDKQEEAFTLISNAVLKEDRLKMLISYVKESKQRKKDVDSLIVDEIQDLLIDIDPDYLKDNIVDIVVGLAYFLPEKAVQLIEKVSGIKSDKGSLEWLLTYVAMIINKGKTEDSIKATSDSEDNPVNDFINNFSKSIGFGINEIKEDEIINVVSKIDNSSDRLYIIREWIKRNKKTSNIYSIMDFAISLMLQNSSIVKPTTTMLLDIVSPVQYLLNKELVETTIKRIDELMVSINSPTGDKIKLHILIIRSLLKHDIDNSNQRAVDLYSFIESLTDYSIKVEAIAYCWALVKKIGSDITINPDEFILDEDFVSKEILKSIDKLLHSTSDHYSEIENTIEVIAEIDIDFALTISRMLNTIERRSHAFLKCIETYVESNISIWDEAKLLKAVSLIEIETIYTKAIISIFDSAYNQRENSKNHRKKIKNLLPLIDKTLGNSIKCYLLTKSILLLSLEPSKDEFLIPKYTRLIEKLTRFQLEFWNKIDSPWEKVIVGYKMSSQLAEYDKALAFEYFSKARLHSQEYIIDNRTHAAAYINSIRLMIRVFCGMLLKDKSYSYDKISGLISHVPSNIDQAELWSELAVRASLSGANDITDEVVSRRILPIIDLYSKGKDKFYFNYILKVSATAIHLAQPATLKLYLESVPNDEKEEIVSSVCFVILTKGHDSDPYDDTIGSPKFNFQDAIEYLELINQVNSDDALYLHIRHLCYIGKNYSSNFVREQKIEIKQRLSTLIASKLPNPRTGVNHMGYAIIAEACSQHFSLDHPNTEVQQRVFKELGNRVNSIPNVADRSYVFSVLAAECGHKKQKIEFLHRAFEEANNIVSVREKVHRYEIALETALKFAPDIFNERIKEIHEEIFKLDESEMFPTFRKLIDIAFKHDKQLAQRLISSLDTDPGRKKLTEPATDHFDKLELEKSVLNDYSLFSKIRDRRHMGNIAWKMLGQLNADKRNTRDIEQTIAIIRTASKAPFMYSAPLFEFFLQNAIKHDNSSNNLLLSLYDSTYCNAELCYNLICSISNKNSHTHAYAGVESDNTYIIKPGFRKEAFEFIGKSMKLSGSSDIYLIDPYFSEEDIHLLKNIMDWCYGSNITVLTSCEAGGDFNRYSFRNAWNRVSSEEPPQTFFVRVTNQSTKSSANAKSPFHDRWILMYDKLQGLNIGTSINSLGLNKASRISTIDAVEVQSVYDQIVVPLTKQRTRMYGGNTVLFETFDF
ncbi:ATP-binding protein [Pontibacter russatus]|uniref:ATP-binding protein n=1 Tax=Pontibacter russatus TaxID=2694929 RepID=UPI0013799EE8|nr:ATP-binding protein [Pontibacter russatus]